MSHMGLGRVETVRPERRRVTISVRWRSAAIFRVRRLFRSDVLLQRTATTFLGGFCDGYYALIAAISGWMPTMFMTRVRL
jgi:hypothetical protein